LFEPRQGKSYAANLAVERSRGDLIIWTDDDVLVDPEWIVEYCKTVEQWPQAVFFGGTIDPWFAEEPPRWLRSYFSQINAVYAARQLGSEVRPLAIGSPLPFGANMAIRRQAFAAFQFNTQLGPSCNTQIRGEEKELLLALQKAGHQGVWVGPARVRHYIPPHRLTSTYLWDFFKGAGRTEVRMNLIRPHKNLWGAPRWAIREYCENRLKSWALSIFKNEAWLRAFCRAAFLKGIILESQAMRVAPMNLARSAELI
jgi:hypothetical protein